jgi:hypothetical protein
LKSPLRHLFNFYFILSWMKQEYNEYHLEVL